MREEERRAAEEYAQMIRQEANTMTKRGYIPRVRHSEFNPYRVYQYHTSDDDTPHFPFHLTDRQNQDKNKWSYQLPTWDSQKQTDRQMNKGKGKPREHYQRTSPTN